MYPNQDDVWLIFTSHARWVNPYCIQGSSDRLMYRFPFAAPETEDKLSITRAWCNRQTRFLSRWIIDQVPLIRVYAVRASYTQTVNDRYYIALRFLFIVRHVIPESYNYVCVNWQLFHQDVVGSIPLAKYRRFRPTRYRSEQMRRKLTPIGTLSLNRQGSCIVIARELIGEKPVLTFFC